MIMGSKRLERVDTDQWNEKLDSFASQINEGLRPTISACIDQRGRRVFFKYDLLSHTRNRRAKLPDQ